MTDFNKKRVVLIQKDDTLRKLLKLIIGSSENYKVVEESCDYFLLNKTILRHRPDIVVLDIQMDLHHDGVKAISLVSKTLPHCQVLVVSPQRNSEIIFSCFRAGASGYVIRTKNIYRHFIDRLDELCTGGAPLSREIARMVVQSFHRSKSELSSREQQVMHLMTEGKSYSQISEELLITKGTSKVHIRNIYKKLNVHNKKEAVAATRETRLKS